MRLDAIADCCRLTNNTDGSGPWVIHIEPDEVQLLLMEDEDVEDVIVLPKNAEYIQCLGEDAWEIVNAQDEDRWHIEWTQFAGLYRDVSGCIWAIPDIVGVRDSDIGSIVKAGNTYCLMLIGGYDPRVARLPLCAGPITSEQQHRVPSSHGVKPVPRELAKLVREVLDHPAPCLLWKEKA